MRVLRRDQTGLNRDIFYGFFVNPDCPDALELRCNGDREFAVWGFEIPGQYFQALRS